MEELQFIFQSIVPDLRNRRSLRINRVEYKGKGALQMTVLV